MQKVKPKGTYFGTRHWMKTLSKPAQQLIDNLHRLSKEQYCNSQWKNIAIKDKTIYQELIAFAEAQTNRFNTAYPNEAYQLTKDIYHNTKTNTHHERITIRQSEEEYADSCSIICLKPYQPADITPPPLQDLKGQLLLF